MRIKYMYYVLKSNYETLEKFKIYNEPYKVGSTQYNRGKVENWESVRDSLVSVSSIDSLKDLCSLFLENPYFSKIDNSFTIPYETYQDLLPKYNILMERIRGVIDFCEVAGFDIIESGFDIKMPATENLDEFSKNIEMFNKSINQCPYLNVNDEKISLKKTDSGSIWFEFCVVAAGASVVLFNLAKIVDKCVKIKSHLVTVKQQEESWRHAKLKNDTLETLVAANKQVTQVMLDECIEELRREIPDVELNKEDEQRVKYSIETISKLMEKGMEIYASIDAPTEVRDLFPASEELSFLPQPKKLLMDSNETEEE